MKNRYLFLILATFFLLNTGFIPVQANSSPPPDNPLPAQNNFAAAASTNVSSPIAPTGMGPELFPAGYNPLTGLPVSNPANLQNPPALISITNWPHTARPQAGLSFSPMVFEVYIGEGMSRFLAMFYGDYPSEVKTLNEPVNNSSSPESSKVNEPASKIKTSKSAVIASDNDATIGPIRSGRLFYEHIRKIYNGFLIMASAYKGVAKNLGDFSNVFGSDENNINSAMVKVSSIEKIAQANRQDLGGNTYGMRFETTPPAGGVAANNLWFFYNILNQIVWKYNPASGGYERYQFTAEEHNTFVQAVDKLNNKPLSYNNIVFLFANHRACKETAFDIDLTFVKKGDAVLFRDGQMYKMNWTTLSSDYERKTGKMRPIRYIDDQGNPFPFKPGQTWVYIIPTHTNYWEVAGTEKIDNIINQGTSIDENRLLSMIQQRQPGSGTWAIRYYASLLITDQAVCDELH